MPKSEKNTQIMPVSINPSRLCIDVLWGLMPKTMMIPDAAVMAQL